MRFAFFLCFQMVFTMFCVSWLQNCGPPGTSSFWGRVRFAIAKSKKIRCCVLHRIFQDDLQSERKISAVARERLAVKIKQRSIECMLQVQEKIKQRSIKRMFQLQEKIKQRSIKRMFQVQEKIKLIKKICRDRSAGYRSAGFLARIKNSKKYLKIFFCKKMIQKCKKRMKNSKDKIKNI